MTAKAPILVQRLADQRLYHVALDRYITVAALRAWQAAGMSFVVRDAQTGDNVTSSVMRLLKAARKRDANQLAKSIVDIALRTSIRLTTNVYSSLPVPTLRCPSSPIGRRSTPSTSPKR